MHLVIKLPQHYRTKHLTHSYPVILIGHEQKKQKQNMVDDSWAHLSFSAPELLLSQTPDQACDFPCNPINHVKPKKTLQMITGHSVRSSTHHFNGFCPALVSLAVHPSSYQVSPSDVPRHDDSWWKRVHELPGYRIEFCNCWDEWQCAIGTK